MVLALLVFGVLLWHEHRFWRAYESAARSSDEQARVDAIDQLGRLGDRRALLLLGRLAPTRADALTALGSMGDGGRTALIEYARRDTHAWRRAAALGSLCGLSPYGQGFLRDPTVRELIAAAMGDKDEHVRAEAGRCAALLQRRQ